MLVLSIQIINYYLFLIGMYVTFRDIFKNSKKNNDLRNKNKSQRIDNLFFFKYLFKTIKNKHVHFDKNIKLEKEFINIYEK